HARYSLRGVEVAERPGDLASHRVDAHHVDVLRQVVEVVAAVGGRQRAGGIGQELVHGAHHVGQLDSGLAAAGVAGAGVLGGGQRDGGDLSAVDQVRRAHRAALAVAEHDVRHL